jgi:hypothetical protein
VNFVDAEQIAELQTEARQMPARPSLARRLWRLFCDGQRRRAVQRIALHAQELDRPGAAADFWRR